jgi:TonB family protein
MCELVQRLGRMWACRAGLSLVIPLVLLGCSERTRATRQGVDGWFRSGMPDERPQMLNDELPFRYPVPLYLQKVQGNVTLRLFVDATGTVLPDSTRIEEPSGHAAFDRAALVGAGALRFRPARRRGTPIAVSLLFPVHFRHPEGVTSPGDSL